MSDYQPQEWNSPVATPLTWIAGGAVVLMVIGQILHHIGVLK